MLRLSRSLVKSKDLKLNIRKCNQQAAKPKQTLKDVPPPQAPLPPPPPAKKSGQLLGYFIAVSIGATSGVVAYAWYDPKFRKQIEDTVPYSKDALDTILPQQSSEAVVGTKPLSVKSVSTEPIASDTDIQAIQEQSLQRSKVKTDVTSTPPEVISKPELTSKQKKEEQKKAETEKKKEEAERKKQEAQKRKQDERERIEKEKQEKLLEQAAENEALESILITSAQETTSALDTAIEAQKSAAAATKEHSRLLKVAMDGTGETDGTEGQWEAVTRAHKARVEAIEAAQQLADNVRSNMEKLKEAIQEGKEHQVTKGNKQLRHAETELKQMKYDFENSVAEVTKALSESKIMKEYRDLIKKGKEQFKQELESVMPEVKIKQGWGGKMSEDDLNSLIAHAHRRIEQLQKQVAEQQALEAQRTERALERQKEEDEKMATSQVKREMEKLKNEFEIEKLTWDTRAKIQMEEDIRQQLARQAAAHSDHLAQVLKIQQGELEAQYEVLVQDRLLEARVIFNQEIAGHIARLKGIEAAVEGRAELEKQGRKAQEMWLACQTLSNIIKEGNKDADTMEDQIKPLANEVMAIKEAGNNHPFVNTIVENFPEEAIIKGVWTEEALQDRFYKVRRICRRVAMVDETNKTLFRYLLSYVQSMFVFTQGKPFSENDEIDTDKLTTFVILDNASYQIEKGDLVQALKFMNMLQGEPRKVASDWIKETRLMLVTKQAGDALLAHSSASGLGSLY